MSETTIDGQSFRSQATRWLNHRAQEQIAKRLDNERVLILNAERLRASADKPVVIALFNHPGHLDTALVAHTVRKSIPDRALFNLVRGAVDSGAKGVIRSFAQTINPISHRVYDPVEVNDYRLRQQLNQRSFRDLVRNAKEQNPAVVAFAPDKGSSPDGIVSPAQVRVAGLLMIIDQLQAQGLSPNNSLAIHPFHLQTNENKSVSIGTDITSQVLDIVAKLKSIDKSTPEYKFEEIKLKTLIAETINSS